MCIVKGQIGQLVISLKLTYRERIVIFSMYFYDPIITLKLTLFWSVEPKSLFITPNSALNSAHWRIWRSKHTIYNRYILGLLFFRRCFIAFRFSYLLLAVWCLAHNAGGGKLLLVSGVMNSLSDLWCLNHHLILLLDIKGKERLNIIVGFYFTHRCCSCIVLSSVLSDPITSG